MNDFIKWCSNRGYGFDGLEIRYQDEDCGNGIFATQTFRQDSVLISVPEYDMITTGFVMDLPFYRKLFKPLNVKLKPIEILTVFFCFEDEEASAWSPYLKVLPRVFTTPAFQKTAFEQSHLPLSIRKYWADQVKEIGTTTKKLMELFPELTADKIIWAWHVVNTRCVFVENEEHDNVDNTDGDTIAVVPFVDMFNHDPTEFQGIALHERVNGRYVVKAKRTVVEGGQVFVCYGAHDNARLLIEYGFMIPTNPNAKVLIPQEILVTMAKIGGLQVTREHEMVLEEAGLASHLYATDEGPSWSLRTNIRILLLEHWQMANGRWKKIIYSQDPIDDETDKRIDEIAEKMIKELANSIEEKMKKVDPNVKWMWMDQIRVCNNSLKAFQDEGIE